MQKLETAATRFGHVMIVDSNDAIGRAILKKGVYDEHGVNFIAKVLKKIGAREVLDVGANIGNHSLAFSCYAEHVWGFEPNPVAYEILGQNVQRNNIHNISVCNFGLSEHDQTGTLFIDESGNLGASTLREESRLEGHSYSTKPVFLKNGDAWIKRNVTKPIDFIKIDVEGHEESVIKGLGQTIKTHRPIVLMEWSDKSSDKKGIAQSSIFKEFFNDYASYATYINTDRKYWKGKSFGGVRKLLARVQDGKRMTYASFSMEDKEIPFKARDILLVPSEKGDVMASLYG